MKYVEGWITRGCVLHQTTGKVSALSDPTCHLRFVDDDDSTAIISKDIPEWLLILCPLWSIKGVVRFCKLIIATSILFGKMKTS